MVKRIFTSIWFLSLIIAVPVIIILPPVFKKYNCKVEDSQEYRNSIAKSIFFEDINNDGTLERFETFLQLESNSFSFHFFGDNGGMVDQINFPVEFNEETKGLFFVDFDNDKNKEVYSFSYQNDSLFLNWIQLTPDIGDFNTLFICELNTYNDGLLDYGFSKIHCLDIDNDNKNELVFAVTGGYSIIPRQIFIVDTETGEINSSENTGCANTMFFFDDLNEDGTLEIIADGQVAPIRDGFDLPYNTPAPYLKVLNSDLDYRFPPIKFFEGIQSITYTSIVKENSSKNLITTFISTSSECIPFRAYKINIKGEIIDSLVFDDVDRTRSKYVFQLDNENFVTQISPSIFLEYDKNLKVAGIIESQNPGDLLFLEKMDVNNDGISEYFFHNQLTSEIELFSNQLKWQMKIKSDKGFPNIVKIINLPDDNFLLASDNGFFTYSFKRNYLYYLQYPVYVLIYFLSVLFIWLIQSIRIKQLKEKYELQNQVNELQLKTLKNQLDPHFIFNTFNSIASVIKQGKKDEAYDLFVHMSKLVRKNLEISNDIYTTLEDELEIIKDYLSIQKFRFNDLFEYRIDIDDCVDKSLMIPKMLLQLHVENALKHGLKLQKKLGELTILISCNNSKVIFVVEDNGIGRIAAKELNTSGTGIGLKAMKQLVDTYNRESKRKLSFQIIDKYDGDVPAGTRIQIELH